MITELQKKYNQVLISDLQKELNLSNLMEVPRLLKIVLNVGLKEAVSNPKTVEVAMTEMRAISAQLPVKTLARKSIAAFKLREGMPLGCVVTLRRIRMYAFLERFLHIALPRVRDFRGLNPDSFDANGNYHTSIKEQIIFPEVDVDQVVNYHGMNISFITSCKQIERSYLLLKKLGIPFREKQSVATSS